MGELVVAVLTGVLVAFGAQQVTKGGLRWRALTTAKHELEVADALPVDDALAGRLQDRARQRVERYLRETPPETRQRWGSLAIGVASMLLGASLFVGAVTIGGLDVAVYLFVAMTLGVAFGAGDLRLPRIKRRS